MRGHVDAESLALYAEGLLSRRQSARIRSHLSSCPECAATQQQLAGVTALLGQVPAAPLPPAAVARLDLALTAEAARRAAGTADAPANGSARAADGWAADGRAADAPPATPAGIPAGLQGTPGASGSAGHARRQARGRGRQGGTGTRRSALRSPAALRLVSVAGAAVVLAAGGYGLSQLFSGSSSSSSSSSSAASGAAVPSARQPQAAALPVVSSKTDYQPGSFDRQAVTAMAKYRPSGAQFIPAQGSGSASAGSTTSGGRGTVSGAATRNGGSRLSPAITPAEEALLRGCTDAIAGGRTVELVDEASYAGRPATVIVLAAQGGQPATVWVVGRGCSAGHPDKITEGPLGG